MSASVSFDKLGLAPEVLSALKGLGYEQPTPIQAQSIPILLNGDDLLAQAQTGTGKTAAFALPLLSDLELSLIMPQCLVLAPTRELAIQVAEAYQSYAKNLKNFYVTPIYGGQDYKVQLRALKRGVHVIVGTPGRVMDHIRRGSLKLDKLKTIVLDEADEMLNMGFVDDIEWILEHIPDERQTALFSATMPKAIKNIAKNYQRKDAKKVTIEAKHDTVDTITQRFVRVAQNQKLDVLTRFLEIEDIDSAIIFTRTKTMASELAEKLQARAYTASALHGDMNQAARQKVVDKIKSGQLDIVVATDVAARGIDVARISHVINYDIPYDAESYIHRIGRTGRAGRSGEALSLITPREQGLLNDIERTIKKRIQKVNPPTIEQMSAKRNEQLATKLINIMQKSKKLGPYRNLVENIIDEADCYPEDLAAAVLYLMEQSNPLPSNDITESKMNAKPKPKPKPKSKSRAGARARTRTNANAAPRRKKRTQRVKKKQDSKE